MNREIKFRGKRKDNGKWVYGDLVRTPITAEFCADGNFFDCGKGRTCIVEDYVAFEVDEETVGQFACFFSFSNKKEVYEGDIVESGFTGRKYVVFWSDENGAFYKQRIGENVKDIPIIQDNAIVFLMGNIHDNPELLEQRTKQET